jgi:hypothetical protein
MKITRAQLIQIIREEVNLTEMQAKKGQTGPDILGKIPGEAAENFPGVMSNPRGAVASAAVDAAKSAAQTAVDLPTAYRSLQKGDSFSISIPASFANSVKSWLTKTRSAIGMNESKESINESMEGLVAGIGLGILALCVTAMMLGYEADVDVGGEVVGQEARAKIVLKAPSGKEV